MGDGDISFACHDVVFQIKNKESIKDWLTMVIGKEGKACGDITIVFCTDKHLLEKNNKYLKNKDLTDVIAFDYVQGSIISGDIFISVERVQENAKTYNVSVRNELCRVMVHGMLHLMGYKDKEAKDIEVMREKEDYYLSLHPPLN